MGLNYGEFENPVPMPHARMIFHGTYSHDKARERWKKQNGKTQAHHYLGFPYITRVAVFNYQVPRSPSKRGLFDRK